MHLCIDLAGRRIFVYISAPSFSYFSIVEILNLQYHKVKHLWLLSLWEKNLAKTAYGHLRTPNSIMSFSPKMNQNFIEN
jgi:hypothetical protein